MSGLSREDRTTLSRFSTGDVGTSRVGRAVARALALIDQQEEALRAAAWPLHAMGPGHPDLPDWARKQVGWIQQLQTRADQQEKALEAADELARCVKEEGPRRRDEAADAYRSARTTSTKEDG